MPLIAQAMRPRGFVEPLSLALAFTFAAIFLLLGLGADLDAARARADRAEARAEDCFAHVEVAIGVLRMCREHLEVQDEACACWVAPEGGAQ